MSTHRGASFLRRLVCLCHGALIVASFSVFGCTAPNPEYPEPLSCAPGERRCAPSADSAMVQVCGRTLEGELTLIDEPCPQGTLCDGGRCAPAEGARSCTRQRDCESGTSCVPLVKDGAVKSFCVPEQPAPIVAGDPCVRDHDCQSYHCLQQVQGRYCLLACGSDNHCPLATPRCQALNVTITGVQGMVGSCSPR